jgi:hypothetical protein
MNDFRIAEPNLHDGLLTSIALRDHDLTLGCSNSDGERYELLLRGIVRLQANDFREGNIILSVERFLGAECPRDLVLKAYGEESDPAATWVPGVLDQIEREGWTLLVLASSYGCTLSALANGPLVIRRVE